MIVFVLKFRLKGDEVIAGLLAPK